MMEFIGQTNHVMLNMLTDYDARQLAKDVQACFEANQESREVMIIKGNKILSISRRLVEGKNYVKMFMKRLFGIIKKASCEALFLMGSVDIVLPSRDSARTANPRIDVAIIRTFLSNPQVFVLKKWKFRSIHLNGIALYQ